ncbi:hypothetical protein H4696_000106 [Amycolatopsis lexingtonensis]|uniref:Uncharacterized protein n=1 Tax=Amycolatopsis lexingtonensis TaxID=218822 RepID=A0ABR9HPZ3_9PSEU|nr:hypothetical protein [Amycolatopsis lexingtonensis]MBE1493006.1 hypothetical protein [Amycolatopsis lexingtonensis]
MSVHAALARPVPHPSRGRHAKPRPAWHRVTLRAVFAASALIIAGVVWPPAALAALVPLGAGVAKLRTASRKIDTIFAEELITREWVSKNDDPVEIS